MDKMNATEQARYDKIPKAYKSKIDAVEYDPEGVGDYGRWWVYSAQGFYFPGSYCAPHSIHEDSWSECLKQLRSVAPCPANCECKKTYPNGIHSVPLVPVDTFVSTMESFFGEIPYRRVPDSMVSSETPILAPRSPAVQKEGMARSKKSFWRT